MAASPSLLVLTFRFPRSDHWHRSDGFHRGTDSSLHCGAGLSGIPLTTLLKACCWAVWPTPTILPLRIDKDSCGTASGYGSVARRSFGFMAPQVHCGVEASLQLAPFGPGPLTGSGSASTILREHGPRRFAMPHIDRSAEIGAAKSGEGQFLLGQVSTSEVWHIPT